MNGRQLFALLTVAAALPAAATIRVTRDGAPVPTAEICYFAAAGTETPFVQQFATNSVSCRAAGNLPPGLWNVFGREGTRFVTARVPLVSVRDSTPDLELRLEPAAVLEFRDLPKDAYGAAYLTDTLSLFPLVNGDTRLLVPASREIVPLLVKNRSILAVGSPIRLEEGGTGRADFPDGRTAVTWLSIAPANLADLRSARKPRLPEVKIVKPPLKPINPVHGTINIDKALQFFRSVPREPFLIESVGVGWRSQRIHVTSPDGNVVVTEQPIRLVPVATAVIAWFVAPNIEELAARLVPDCKPARQRETPLTIRVMRCPGARNDSTGGVLISDSDRCTEVRSQPLPRSRNSGQLRIDDLEAGSYVVEARYSDLPPIRRLLTARTFDEEVVRLPIEYSSIFGKVTIGGSEPPSPLRIDFFHDFEGSARAVTDAHGEYFALLQKTLPKDRAIRIRSCDSTTDADFIVDHDVPPNSRFDIDLPSNELTVEVVDASNGAPVVGARIRYGAFRTDEMSSVYFYRVAMHEDDGGHTVPTFTGDNGRVVVANLPADKKIRVCASHQDYEDACADTFTMSATDTRTVRIAMKPRGGLRGMVVAPGFAGGDLYWFGSDGQQSEFVPIKPDGTFRYMREHGPDEVIVVVTTNLPLYIQRQPMLQQGDELRIVIPPAPARSFEVSISDDLPQRDALVTVAVGDLIVPYPAFAQHLAYHGSMLDLRNRGPLLVPDILETAPLSVLLGPPPNEIGPGLRRIDLFRLPQYRGVPRKPVTGARVIF